MENILIKNSNINTASNGNKYLNMNIVFNNEEYNAKYWDYLRLNKDVKQVLKKDLPAVFSVDLEENYFNDNKQYIIKKFYKYSNDFDMIKEYYRKADVNLDLIKTYLKDKIKFIKKELNLDLTDIILNDKFLNYPAARNIHNAYMHGLVEHTYHMLVFADKLLYSNTNQKDFSLETYLQDDEFLNKPLVFAGILLHDVAKIFEYEEKSAKFGIGVDTNKAKLLGHIYNGAELVNSLDCDENIKIKLKHIILSHHKRKDWGSPIEPKTPEAWFVHLMDYMDAKMEIIREAKDKYKNGWTSKITGLNNNKLFLN